MHEDNELNEYQKLLVTKSYIWQVVSTALFGFWLFIGLYLGKFVFNLL